MQKNYNTTAYREELRSQTLIVAMSLFKRNGVKSVKMDDIANELGISKRTLYEMYSNKEDLLYECVRNDKQRRRQQIVDFAKTADNEMEVMTYFFRLQLSDLGSTNPVFFTDILKYTKTVEYLKNFKLRQKSNSREFINRGIEQGYFRSDVNYEIMDRLSDAAMENVMQTKMYRLFPLSKIFCTFMLIFTRTCCTEKGQKYLAKFLCEDAGSVV